MGANESQAIYPEEVIEEQLGSEHSLSRTFSPPPSAPLSEAEPEESSLSDGKTTSEMIDLADDGAGQHLADAAECLRVAKLLDYHYHTVVQSRSDARTPRSLSRRLMGERMTADKLAEQQHAMHMAQVRDRAKRGLPPQVTPVERDVISVVGIMLRHGHRYDDGTVLITLGELKRHVEALPSPGDESLPLEQLLLHAANHAAVKYDKQAASSYLPLESPDDDDIVIETGASAKTSTL